MTSCRPAALMVVTVLAVSACSSTTASRGGARATATTADTRLTPPSAAATLPTPRASPKVTLTFPKVSPRDLVRITFPSARTQKLRRVPNQDSYSVVAACSAADPKATLTWEMLDERPGGRGSLSGGRIVCDGSEDFALYELPMVGGQIGLHFKHRSDRVTRAYAVLRSGTE